ncbi:3-isopropylmalate dehydratase small subunit 3 [Gracilariopsis chorda]|uniref:3-isopropylmalate dehydratase n=1 Tax=Gracilariopsis chorda TaxID=448386 RepID=A0A2V3IHX6_9FLOR|nr:3-isopropylmalate dehydratase small subunit 3 [Gracilariopsis chorda]|eukprot:PXF41696.1 3-isopropylmalate dehydratase small subunit 3 [Gracilariopsis chorda]
MAANTYAKRDGNHIRGKVFVVRDNIDTDQIIPAEYLTLVPSDPEEYRKLGSFALIGLPEELYPTRYVQDGQYSTEYPIIIAGDNFGCGSSREHAPVALGASGGCAVVAQSYARIFFRNCSATGELYPWESQQRLVEEFTTGDEGDIDFEKRTITNVTTGRKYKLNELGDVQPVIDAGGIFEYARQTGMISKK